MTRKPPRFTVTARSHPDGAPAELPPGDQELLLKAINGGDSWAAIQLIAAYLNTSKPARNVGESFVQIALREIMDRLIAKEKPDADRAFRLSVPAGNPKLRRDSIKDHALWSDLYALIVTEKWKQDAAFKEVAGRYGMTEGSVRTFWRTLPEEDRRR